MSVPAPAALLSQQAHRPWPVPDRAWVMRQTWDNLLFAHWPLPPAALRPLVPPSLPLDLAEGSAWVGIVPFLVRNSRVRALPPVPGATGFPELNVRTYVKVDGKPGVYFFSLDAGSALAVLGARVFYRLPYFEARMECAERAGWTVYSSRRSLVGAGRLRAAALRADFGTAPGRRVRPAAALVVRYRPAGDVFRAAPGTLDHFLTERYCLYTARRARDSAPERSRPEAARPDRQTPPGRSGWVRRVDIHHPPWLLCPATAEFTHNTMARAAGIELPETSPLLHLAAVQHVLIWSPAVVG